MMGSLFSAVSGLKAQTTSLNVIANNLANVNTTGYKAQTVSFSDLLSQTLSGASGSTGTLGGTNPIQVGLGVGVASTSTDMTTGSTESTGVATDVAISGAGFFVVTGGTEGEYQYTREGDFSVDADGNLTVNGYKVCGWLQHTTDSDGNAVYDTNGKVEALNIYSDAYNGNKKIMAAKATAEATFSGNLPSTAEVASTATALNAIGTTPTSYDKTTDVTCYDSQGNSHTVTVNWKKCYVDSTDADNPVTSWYWSASAADGSTISPSEGYVKFDKNGSIITTDSSYSTTPSIAVKPSAGTGTSAFNVKLDFSTLSQNTSTSKITATADGYTAGELQSFSISSDGTIIGSYSNNQTQALCKICLATFTNPQGLKKSGDNLYVTSANSGTISYVPAGEGGTSSLSTGCLEMSNVDLASQFSRMMISQRAYQANSKVLSTSDQMLETIINVIR